MSTGLLVGEAGQRHTPPTTTALGTCVEATAGEMVHFRRAGLRPLLRRALPTQAVAAVVHPMTAASAQKQAGPVALAGAESCGLNKDPP